MDGVREHTRGDHDEGNTGVAKELLKVELDRPLVDQKPENGRQCNAGTTNWAISSQLSQCQACCDTSYPSAYLGAQNTACRAECGK